MNKNVLNGNENETPLLYDDANSLNNYSLLCHGVTTSPTNAVKKRDKLRHRFSDVGSWGRRRKNKKGIRQFHSMNETIEVLADPVIEDDIFVSSFFYLICIYFVGDMTIGLIVKWLWFGLKKHSYLF